MKRIISLLLTIVAIYMTSCIRNDGDIGNLFGNWVIESIENDGKVDANYITPVQINFQGNLFSIGETKETEVYTPELVGTWSETSNKMILNGDYNAGTTTQFPASLGLGKEKIVEFEIVTKEHNYMEWRRTTSGGNHYLYRLKKLL